MMAVSTQSFKIVVICAREKWAFGDPEIFESTALNFSGFSTALDWRSQAALGHGMPPQPQRASLDGRISVVCFGSVGGNEFDVGWGTDPQTPDFMYFYVFIVLYKLFSTTEFISQKNEDIWPKSAPP